MAEAPSQTSSGQPDPQDPRNSLIPAHLHPRTWPPFDRSRYAHIPLPPWPSWTNDVDLYLVLTDLQQRADRDAARQRRDAADRLESSRLAAARALSRAGAA